jgi:hypothetical protein
MQERPEQPPLDNPLRHLTPAQFMALGGNAVVYVRSVSADKVAEFMDETELTGQSDYQIVIAGDGSPLLVADSPEAVEDWLAERNYGVATVH